jgi:hypothetical protein
MYDAVETTLRRRRAGINHNARLLTDLEEKMLVERILEPDSNGGPPNLRPVGDMANLILAGRNGRKVGIN